VPKSLRDMENLEMLDLGKNPISILGKIWSRPSPRQGYWTY